MKHFFLIFCLFISLLSNAQSDLDGYKYILCPDLEYVDGSRDRWGISNQIRQAFKKIGFTVFTDLKTAKKQPDYRNRTLFVDVNHTNCTANCYNYVYITVKNLEDEQVLYLTDRGMALTMQGDFRNATRKALSKIFRIGYKFNPDKGLKKIDLTYDLSTIGLDYLSDESVRRYFEKNGANYIEGIWEINSTSINGKVAVVKSENYFDVILLEGQFQAIREWRVGEVKAKIEAAASEEIVTIDWTLGNKKDKERVVGIVKAGALIEFEVEDEKSFMYKVFPKIGENNSKQKRDKDGWAGNGSGLILSKTGYIVTNNHVIEDAEKIEVECFIGDEMNSFNAEVIQQDKINDLAIIKIFDLNFDQFDEPQYSFESKSFDVGTKVYAYGYPMALSVMGKEIKVTDGIISSKTGFEGDVTTYQITAPIQGGNSGGPLFDENANLIGINSSGLRKDVADNVGYTIKSSYLINLIDVLSNKIVLPKNNKLIGFKLTDQIKELSKSVVLIKIQ